ncbi:hypothetical protein BAU14_00470 [Enterococcus sp. CU9D]|nr:hypothetical protein BAU14_00470 [Enterococcus sp. CU9D]
MLLFTFLVVLAGIAYKIHQRSFSYITVTGNITEIHGAVAARTLHIFAEDDDCFCFTAPEKNLTKFADELSLNQPLSLELKIP